nr:MAG TPA: Minor capsid protein [Caudoviricetes sp.]
MARTDGNEIVYTGDQARYLYEGKVMVDAATGKGPMNIPGVGLRWHKGATLTPTAKDLVFTTDMHPQAQSHWMEASYKKNGDKWARVAEKAVISSLG